MTALPTIDAGCLRCGRELDARGPQTCPGCGHEIRPVTLDRTLGEIADTLRQRDAVLVLAPTPDGLRLALVDARGGVQVASAPAGQGGDVRPVAALLGRLRVSSS